MRICFICSEYPPDAHGGIGAFTQLLGRGLVQRGHEVHVIGAYTHATDAATWHEDEGVRVWRPREPTHWLGWVQARHQLFRVLSRWCSTDVVDIIEVPDFQGWAAGWPALPVPVIARLHGSASYFSAEMGRKLGRTTYWLERSSLWRADAWCSTSRYTAEKTRKVFDLNREAAVLPNGVRIPPACEPDTRSRNRVVFSGTLTEKKGVIPLVRAWRELIARHPQAELHLYGKDGSAPGGGSMQAWLLAEAGEQAARTISFFGHVPRESLLEALRSARLAVFPSYAEAFALAPLEAMACGCPTIYTARGSGPELIAHGKNGLLIDPDRPAEIAAAIELLLREDDVAQRIGQAGRELTRQNYSIEHLVARNEAFYEDCRARFGTSAFAASN